jgi:hypothetical protein
MYVDPDKDNPRNPAPSASPVSILKAVVTPKRDFAAVRMNNNDDNAKINSHNDAAKLGVTTRVMA